MAASVLPVRKRRFNFPSFGKKKLDPKFRPGILLDRQDSSESRWSSLSSQGSKDSDSSPRPRYCKNYLSIKSSEIGDSEYLGSGSFTAGAPTTSSTRLILPLWAVTVRGLFRQKFRRLDSKVLKRLDQEIQKTLLELVNNLSLFDIEMVNDVSRSAPSRKDNETTEGIKTKRRSSRGLLKQLSKLTRISFDSDQDSDTGEESLPVLIRSNLKLADYGISATLCKEEQRLIGANTFLYFLEVATVENPGVERLPLRKRSKKKEAARSETDSLSQPVVEGSSVKLTDPVALNSSGKTAGNSPTEQQTLEGKEGIGGAS
mmetsp:Transcript_4456/g.5022  ORF Transcript_4456/g.5022 Transcript_4456/m.5022 type:complete len:316 (-) Transcript_4456:224-1171(-)